MRDRENGLEGQCGEWNIIEDSRKIVKQRDERRAAGQREGGCKVDREGSGGCEDGDLAWTGGLTWTERD